MDHHSQQKPDARDTTRQQRSITHDTISNSGVPRKKRGQYRDFATGKLIRGTRRCERAQSEYSDGSNVESSIVQNVEPVSQAATEVIVRPDRVPSLKNS